jgi:protein O-mannosyl-transferase
MSDNRRKAKAGQTAANMDRKPGSVPIREPAEIPSSKSGVIPQRTKSQIWLIVLGLIIVTAAVYAPVRHYDFIRWDDPQYVSENPYVAGGLNWNAVVWAFTTGHAAYWHPITWLSHMMDVQLYGLNANRHHLTSVFIHIINSILLFFLLRRMTGAQGRSAFVAALFAVHPLHVESVAWIAERKDVLSTLFWLLTVWAYVSYIREPVKWRYVAVLVLYALGSMSKPMLVTLPCVLLLLDVWPLRRVEFATRGQSRWAFVFSADQQSKVKSLVLEKIPLFAIALTSSIITFFVQRNTGGIAELGALPLSVRAGNAIASYGKYILKMFWPVGLSALYPLTGTVDPGQVIISALALIAVSVLVVRSARTHPYLVVGWLWFLGQLVPVIGFIQVGPQSMADRYTYVPIIGLFIMLAWGIPDLLARWSHARNALPAAAIVAICACAILARNQVGYWQSGFDLWGHAVAVTSQNYMASNNFGVALAQQGRVPEAINYFRDAINIKPDYLEAHSNLAVAYTSEKRNAEATNEYAFLAQIKPNDPAARTTLARALAGQGRLDEAIQQYSNAATLAPNSAEAQYNLGSVLASAGRFAEAATHYTAALRIKPDYADAHNNLGLALANEGRVDDAIREFQEAARNRPADATFEYNLGVMFVRKGNTAEALNHIGAAVKMKPDYADAIRAFEALKSSGK